MVIMIKTFIKKNIITLTLAILLLVLSVVSLFIGALEDDFEKKLKAEEENLKEKRTKNIKALEKFIEEEYKKSFYGFTGNGSLCDIKTAKTSGYSVYRSRNECSRTYNAAVVHE